MKTLNLLILDHKRWRKHPLWQRLGGGACLPAPAARSKPLTSGQRTTLQEYHSSDQALLLKVPSFTGCLYLCCSVPARPPPTSSSHSERAKHVLFTLFSRNNHMNSTRISIRALELCDDASLFQTCCCFPVCTHLTHGR